MHCQAHTNAFQRDNLGAPSFHGQCDRVAKVMDSKSIGLCPQGFESPRCRCSHCLAMPTGSASPDTALLQHFCSRHGAGDATMDCAAHLPNERPSGGGHAIGIATARGFEPLRAEPNGFLVHHLSHSVTLSHSCELRCAAAHDCCRHSGGLGPEIRPRPGGGRSSHSCSLHHPESSSNAAQHMATWPAHLDSEGIRTLAGRAQWISSPSP